MAHEELLQVLVSVVDAQLLKTVLIKVLESEDIEYSDRGSHMLPIRLRLVNGQVNLFNNPDEHAAIDAFDEGITYIHGGFRTEGGQDGFSAREDGFSR